MDVSFFEDFLELLQIRSIASMKNIILVLLFTMFVYGIARVIVSVRFVSIDLLVCL